MKCATAFTMGIPPLRRQLLEIGKTTTRYSGSSPPADSTSLYARTRCTMNVVRTGCARRLVGIAAMVQMGCASPPPPAALEVERVPRVPHSCRGAHVMAYTGFL